MGHRVEHPDPAELLRERAWLDRVIAGLVDASSDRDELASSLAIREGETTVLTMRREE